MFREIDAEPECSLIRIPRNYPVYGKGDGGSMAGRSGAAVLGLEALKSRRAARRRYPPRHLLHRI